MAYFLGRDVKVAIVTENSDKGLDVSDAGVVGVASDVTGTGMDARGGASGSDDTNDAQIFATNVSGNTKTNPLQNLVSVDLTLGTVDEDIAYMGQRTALKAEIKKETTIALTLKKALPFFDAVFNQARYGIDSTDDSLHDGLTQPDVEFGYRVYVALNDGTEVITIPNCTMSEHTVALNADGVTEETVTFTSHVTPLIGQNPNSTITGSDAL